MRAALWLAQGYASEELREMAELTRQEARQAGRQLLPDVLALLGWPLRDRRNARRVRAHRIIAMSARISIQVACGLLGIAVVTGCTNSPAAPHRAASHHAASRAAPPRPQPLTRAAASQCPKTIISRVAGPPGASPADVVPGTSAYGNGTLVVTLDVHGVIVASGDMVHPDGSIWWKFPWWRLVRGHLAITGRRLDAPAAPLTSFVPDGYGDIGFQASGVIFPSEGCWQVTGTIAHTSLTFVTLVIPQAHRAVISSSG